MSSPRGSGIKRYRKLCNILKHNTNILTTNNPLILDIACGKALGSDLLSKELKSRVFACDIDISFAQSKKNVKVIHQDIVDLDFESNKFDLAVCSETLEHLARDDSQMAVNELKRVVKEDGYIIVTVPENKQICLANKYHKQYLSKQDIEMLFKKDCIREDFFVKSKGKMNRILLFSN